MIYVANVPDSDLPDAATNAHVIALRELAASEGMDVVPISAQIEAELSELDPEEALVFLNDLGLKEPGLNRLVQVAYKMLGLQTFLTAGEKEVRAWTIRQGDKAPTAAGVIHTDLERTFVRALVIDWQKRAWLAPHGGKRLRHARRRCRRVPLQRLVARRLKSACRGASATKSLRDYSF
jgi:hypothetical protein